MEKETINRLIREWSGINRDDFDHDLNAMHEAEEKLSESEVPEYGTNLNTIMERQARSPLIEIDICDWHATSAQRAEALLRTIGKWTATDQRKDK